MENFFKLRENGTTVRTEILAGLTTFMTMGLDQEGTVEIPLGGYRLDGAYTDLDYREMDGVLRVEGKPFTAGAFLLKKGGIKS